MRVDPDSHEIRRLDAVIAELRGQLDAFYAATRGYTEGSPAETFERMLAENERLRARLATLEPVWRAAKQWRHFEGTVTPGSLVNPEVTLLATIDAALAAEEKAK